ncbi:hypothetical protein [Pontibacter saemangeumensis]|uniref:hypothetical protein n=1 Tax=Pontibacter saemangeumensis TaxID=1084525 RepID=UPI0031E515D8
MGDKFPVIRKQFKQVWLKGWEASSFFSGDNSNNSTLQAGMRQRGDDKGRR